MGAGPFPLSGFGPSGGIPCPCCPLRRSASAVCGAAAAGPPCGFLSQQPRLSPPPQLGRSLVCALLLLPGPPRCVGGLRWAAAAPPAAAVARQPPAYSTPRIGSARVKIYGPLRGPPLRSLAGRARLRLSALAGCPWRVPPVAPGAAAAPPGGAVAALRAAFSASAPPGFVLPLPRCFGVAPPSPSRPPPPVGAGGGARG